MNGKFLKQKRAIDVYQNEMIIENQESAFPDFKPVSCAICENGNQNKCRCYRLKYKDQRQLKENDGLLYYYQQNKGKIPQQQQFSEQRSETMNNLSSQQQGLISNENTNNQSNFSKLQMLICVTMYNESYEMLERTLVGIQQNLANFEKMGLDSRNFAVVVIQDGIEKMNPQIKENLFENWIDKDLNLDGLQFDKNGYIRVTDNIQDEYEKQLTLLKTKTVKYRCDLIQQGRKNIMSKEMDKKKYIEQNNNFPGNIPKHVAQLYQVELDYLKDGQTKPLTTFFCNKHLNGQKLSSHLWFFQGFCRLLQPKYLSLVDVGTMPDSMGLVNYYKALEGDPHIGGVSGFMGLYFDGETDEYKEYAYKLMKEQKANKTCEQWAYMTQDNQKYYLGVLENINIKLNQKKQEIQFNQQKEVHNLSDNDQKDKYSLKTNVFKQYLKDIRNFNTTKDEIVYNETALQKLIQQKDEILKYKDDEDYIKMKKEERMDQLEFELDKGKPSCLDKIGNCFLSLFYYIFLKIHLYFDVKKAQVFEYALAHYMDKNFESFFGFLQVLPGAWSCYRYEALNKAQKFKENLVEKRYLKGALNPNMDKSKLSLEENNMYLAEDRILCLGIFAQEFFKYSLKYVPNARAYTDAIDNNIEFMLQRRRWINSTWFALNYVLRNYNEHMKKSKHGAIKKKIGIPFMMFMTYLGQVNAYLLVGFFSFALYTSATQLFIPIIDHYNISSTVKLLPLFFLIFYSLIVIFLLYLSLNIKINKQNSSYKLYGFISGIFGVYNLIIYLIIIYNIFTTYITEDPIFDYQNQTSSEIIIIKTLTLIMIGVSMGSIAIMIISQLIDSNSHSTVLKMILSVPSYLYYSAMYTHTLLIYAFCNIDDFSWGTKGSSDASQDSAYQKYRDYKIFYIAKWMLWNSLLCFILVIINDYFGGRGYVLLFIGGYAAVQLGLKFIFSFTNHLKFYLYDNCKSNSEQNQKKYLIIKQGIRRVFENQQNSNQRNTLNDQNGSLNGIHQDNSTTLQNEEILQKTEILQQIVFPDDQQTQQQQDGDQDEDQENLEDQENQENQENLENQENQENQDQQQENSEEESEDSESEQEEGEQQQDGEGQNQQGQEENGFCLTDDDCESLFICNSQGNCEHKPLFPLTTREIIGLLFLLVLVGFAQAGGIGGGPILLPIILGILNYDAKQAIAISYVLIFGGSCGNFLNNYNKQTENQTPLIWYDLVLLSIPYLLSGAIIGVAFNHFLPSLLIMVILIYVLQNSATKTYKNYKKLCAQEQNQQNEQQIPLIDMDKQEHNQQNLDQEFPQLQEQQEEQQTEEQKQKLEQIMEIEKNQFPKQKFLKMGIVLAIVVFLSLLKGGKGMASLIGISPCGFLYWIMNFIIIGSCFLLTAQFSKEMMAYEEEKEKVGFNFEKYGEKFDQEKIYSTGKSAFLAGGIGGLLGLGGGVILTPKWLDMGIPSDRAAATATFTVCFTSFISFFSSLLAGKYQFLEAVFFWIISFAASFIVSTFLKWLVDKYKKKSILIGVLLIVIILALVMLPILQIGNLIQDPQSQLEFGNLC
ncbi:hypothetical protein PPERSA_04958 [Pseudocohnilembus persalinus]|uniref:chitin synthase n=1 Tax=Pseudocohnilembus persalinus TaxID=266149 RepID=A0A0V0QVE4_PSEPJ|nr:hypothetical protein PPERSA_04958 [Pseudocohnilembus persalinus]|eukprot:KRX06345.1 hypothetical protein PPERSA_04958 [Pseudocohnilembus persalinus]